MASVANAKGKRRSRPGITVSSKRVSPSSNLWGWLKQWSAVLALGVSIPVMLYSSLQYKLQKAGIDLQVEPQMSLNVSFGSSPTNDQYLILRNHGSRSLSDIHVTYSLRIDRKKGPPRVLQLSPREHAPSACFPTPPSPAQRSIQVSCDCGHSIPDWWKIASLPPGGSRAISLDEPLEQVRAALYVLRPETLKELSPTIEFEATTIRLLDGRLFTHTLSTTVFHGDNDTDLFILPVDKSHEWGMPEGTILDHGTREYLHGLGLMVPFGDQLTLYSKRVTTLEGKVSFFSTVVTQTPQALPGWAP